MKNLMLNFVFVCLSFFGIIGSVLGQQYEEFGLLIRFDEGTPQDTIDQIKSDYNCSELWFSPLTDTYNWKVNNFPFIIPGTTDTISDIQEAVDRSKKRSGVNDTALNYHFFSPYVSQSNGNSTIPDIPLCYERCIDTEHDNSNSVKICIMDSGFNPNYNDISVDSGYN